MLSKTSNLPDFFIPRAMTVPEAEKMVGDKVVDKVPNVNEAGIYRDADTGEAFLVYAPAPRSMAILRGQIPKVKWTTTLRAKGTRNVSKIFGMTNRSVVLRREACAPAGIAWESPALQMELNAHASALADYLHDVLPEVWEHDYQTVDAVLPEWRMTEDSLWTSGVINQSSSLPYHRDGSNFDTWSAMPVIRRGMDGGHLHIPEYDMTINCRDGWQLSFNGFRYVHGVTPMKPRTKDGYRYSIVFYAKKGMKDCHTYALEMGQAKARRSAREHVMAEKVKLK
jgi:hypothetical protein